jgi:integral membrane sensor domain MASE1
VLRLELRLDQRLELLSEQQLELRSKLLLELRLELGAVFGAAIGLALGAAVGSAFGATLGAALRRSELGASFGATLGAALGVAFGATLGAAFIVAVRALRLYQRLELLSEQLLNQCLVLLFARSSAWSSLCIYYVYPHIYTKRVRQTAHTPTVKKRCK